MCFACLIFCVIFSSRITLVNTDQLFLSFIYSAALRTSSFQFCFVCHHPVRPASAGLKVICTLFGAPRHLHRPAAQTATDLLHRPRQTCCTDRDRPAVQTTTDLLHVQQTSCTDRDRPVKVAVHWVRVGAIITEFNIGGYQCALSR